MIRYLAQSQTEWRVRTNRALYKQMKQLHREFELIETKYMYMAIA